MNENKHATIRELAFEINSHLHKLGELTFRLFFKIILTVNKFGAWIPHNLLPLNKEKRVESTELLERYPNKEIFEFYSYRR